MPLVLDKYGKKFGKSEGNALWLDLNKTSSYQLYQYLVNVDDSLVVDYLKIFTFLTKEEIEELDKSNREHPEKREAHKALAREIITDLHGKEEYERALKLSEVLFTGEFKDLKAKEIEEIFKGNEIREVSSNKIVDLLVELGAVSSKREAREMISGKAISINGDIITDLEFDIDKKMFIDDKYIIVRRGKKKYFIGKRV